MLVVLYVWLEEELRTAQELLKSPNPLCLAGLETWKTLICIFFNTHNSVVWCLVNSCLIAELTAVGFTHPLEMLKLEKKI